MAADGFFLDPSYCLLFHLFISDVLGTVQHLKKTKQTSLPLLKTPFTTKTIRQKELFVHCHWKQIIIKKVNCSLITADATFHIIQG